MKQSLALLLLAATLGLSAGEARAQILYSENFDGYTTGSIGTVGATPTATEPGEWASSGSIANVVADSNAPSQPNDFQIGTTADATTGATNGITISGTSPLYTTFDVTPTYTPGNGDVKIDENENGTGNVLLGIVLAGSGDLYLNNGSGNVDTGIAVTLGDMLNVTFKYTTTSDFVTVIDTTKGTFLENNDSIGIGAAQTPVTTGAFEISTDGYGTPGVFGTVDNITISTSPVPEPTTLGLVSLFGLGLMWFVHRTRRSTAV